MSKLLSIAQQRVTPADAYTLLSLLPSYQRSHMDWRSDILLARMTNGEYHDCISDVSIARINGSGERHLINGQQSLNAVIKLGQPRDLVIREVEVQDEAEARQMFLAIDDPTSARTEDDIIKCTDLVRLMSTKQWTANKSLLKAAVAGAMMAEDIDGTPTPVLTTRAKLFTVTNYVRAALDWKAEITTYYSLLDNHSLSDVTRLKNRNVVANCLYILRHGGQDGYEFVEGIMQNTNDKVRFPNGDPRRAVVNWFSVTKNEGTQMSHPKWFRGIGRAWNHYNGYRNSKGLSRIQNTDAPQQRDWKFINTPSW